MKAKESDSVLRDGKYPNGLTHVYVLAFDKDTGLPVWTSGRPTGKVGQHGEHFEVVTDSPLVESDKSMYHKEDIRDPSKHDITEMNR
jgi:hypothetical protein